MLKRKQTVNYVSSDGGEISENIMEVRNMGTGKFMQTAANRDYAKSWQAPGSFPWILQQPKDPIKGRPYSVRENYIRCVKGEKPYWMPTIVNTYSSDYEGERK